MSRTHKDSPNRDRSEQRTSRTRRRNISVRAVRRDQPDLRKLSRAVIDLAIAQAEADAQGAEPLAKRRNPDSEHDG